MILIMGLTLVVIPKMLDASGKDMILSLKPTVLSYTKSKQGNLFFRRQKNIDQMNVTLKFYMDRGHNFKTRLHLAAFSKYNVKNYYVVIPAEVLWFVEAVRRDNIPLNRSMMAKRLSKDDIFIQDGYLQKYIS